jgi:hypothetical protein
VEHLRMIKERDKKFKLWKNCKNLLIKVYRDDYNQYRNYVTNQLRASRIEYFKRKFNIATDMKSYWQVINETMGKEVRQSSDDVIAKFNGKKEPLDQVVSKFAQGFITDVSSIIHSCRVKTVSAQFQTIPAAQSMITPRITTNEILQIIDQLNKNKQPGFDNIRVCDLQRIKYQISPFITKLVNMSIRDRTVPDKLKIAIVKPIYKKGEHMDYKNYRPISILPVLDKILERSVANKLINYLNTFNVINNLQFGFQKNKSTSDLFVQFTNIINSSLNKNEHVLALFIDFTKAFDTINHDKLIVALEDIGIRGCMLGWFENYLQNRTKGRYWAQYYILFM